MAFVPTTWVDGSAPGITAAQLNRIETGIDDAHADGFVTPAQTTFMNSNGENAAIYVGAWLTTGTAIRLPTGWSVVRNAVGSYTLTHNLGTTGFIPIVVAGAATTQVRIAAVTGISTTTVSVVVHDETVTRQDATVRFILVRY